MRFLALHGRFQCGKTFARKLGAKDGNKIIKLKDPVIEIICLDAPFQVEPQVKHKGAKRKLSSEGRLVREWWDPNCANRNKAISHSLDHVRSELQSKGPFDGVIGFSQGGCFASIICREKVSRELNFAPEVGIFCSAYAHEDAERNFLQNPDDSRYLDALRSVHLYGRNDKIIPQKKSETLCEEMKGKHFVHDLGHAIPVDKFHHVIQLLVDNQHNKRGS